MQTVLRHQALKEKNHQLYVSQKDGSFGLLRLVRILNA